MSKKNNADTLLTMSLENVKAITQSCTREEVARVFAKAAKAASNIRMREDAYSERIPDEILKKPFEIVK